MPFKQLASLLIALIVVMSATLFVITRGGDSGDTSATAPTTSAATSSTTSTTSAPTTLAPVVTIPTECSSQPTGETATSTTAEASTTTIDPAAGDSTSTTVAISPTLGGNSSVSTVGLDTVTFGLTVKQAEVAAGTSMTPCSPVSSCYRVTPLDAPEGISFVVDEGTIERVDITDGPITTRSGLGIGTAETRIVESLGDKLDRQVNDDGSIDLIFVPTDPGDADFRIIFTIRDGVVDTFRSGRVPLILAGDACA